VADPCRRIIENEGAKCLQQGSTTAGAAAGGRRHAPACGAGVRAACAARNESHMRGMFSGETVVVLLRDPGSSGGAARRSETVNEGGQR